VGEQEEAMWTYAIVFVVGAAVGTGLALWLGPRGSLAAAEAYITALEQALTNELGAGATGLVAEARRAAGWAKKKI
jgi:hypothetical protein